SEPVAMMNHIRNALKPTGRVVLVEFRKEDPAVPIQPLHKMSVPDVRSELEPLGFKFQRSLEFLPWQHIIFFSDRKSTRLNSSHDQISYAVFCLKKKKKKKKKKKIKIKQKTKI